MIIHNKLADYLLKEIVKLQWTGIQFAKKSKLPQSLASRMLYGKLTLNTFKTFYKNYPDKKITEKALRIYLSEIKNHIANLAQR